MVAIGKTRLSSDDVDRRLCSIISGAAPTRRLVLDRLGRRLPGFNAERTAELART
jgi:hypothetical protein